MPSPTLDCEDPSISRQARAALLRLRARVARRGSRWRDRLLRGLPSDEGRTDACRAGTLVEAA